MTTIAPNPSLAVIPPGSLLGMVGGGQLGRMWCQIAHSMGYRTVVLDPDPDSPAGHVAYEHLQASYTDTQALQYLGQQCAAISIEFENVPAHSLVTLAQHTRVCPHAAAVAIAQDRLQEKAQLQAAGVAVGPYCAIASAADCKHAQASLFPAILKTAKLGYDGKGQKRLQRPEDLTAAWQGLGAVPCILEHMLPLALELSVIIARNDAGHCVHLPVQRNMHHQGILAATEVACGLIAPALAQQAITAAQAIAAHMHYVGVLGVEFFVLHDGRILANEMAPRPHNSGHYSIEACDLSQFALQLRCMTGLPLITPRQHSVAIMLNVLGDIWFTNATTPQEPDWSAILQAPPGSGIHLHLYGKTTPRIGRKMGHITITAPSFELAQIERQRISALLGWPQHSPIQV